MMCLLGLALVLCLGGSAEAKAPRKGAAMKSLGEATDGDEFEAYFQFVESVGMNALVQLDEERVKIWFSVDPKDGEALRRKAIALCTDLEEQIRSHDYPPEARAYREALLNQVEHKRKEVWGAEWEATLALLSDRPVRPESRTRLETLVRASNARTDALEEARKAALVEFAKGANVEINFVEGPPLASSFMPVFVHADFPPPGSPLSSTLWVAFPNRYANHITELSSRMIGLMNEWVDALDAGPEQAKEARAAISSQMEALSEEVRKVSPWEGDDALVEELRANVDEAARLVGPLGKEYVHLAQKKRVTKEEVGRANAYILRVNTTGERSRMLDASTARFRVRWGVTAYQDWRTANMPTPL